MISGNGQYLDLGFLVDSSTGVNWNELIAFVKAIIQSFDISYYGTHVGFISFADQPRVDFDFATNTNPSAEVLIDQINGITPSGGRTRRIDLAFNAALTKLFVTQNGMRLPARKVRVILLMMIIIYSIDGYLYEMNS